MEAELICFMFNFIYMLCMYLLPEVTLVDSMGAIPVLILVYLKLGLLRKGSRGFALWC